MYWEIWQKLSENHFFNQMVIIDARNVLIQSQKKIIFENKNMMVLFFYWVVTFANFFSGFESLPLFFTNFLSISANFSQLSCHFRQLSPTFFSISANFSQLSLGTFFTIQFFNFFINNFFRILANLIIFCLFSKWVWPILRTHFVVYF
jgi:hypothetical protein